MERLRRSSGRPDRSSRLFARAQRVLVGGVNSPVRAFRSVGIPPRFVIRGRGPWIVDADGRKYLDLCLSWGALLLGHAHPAVVRAVQEAAEAGTSFGAATEAEVRLAEAVARRMPSMERMRFVSSGTEAAMSAVRVARGFTRRDKIIKFEGCYHGHADALLARAGSGVAAAGLPGSAGVPADTVRHTLVARYNDLASVESLFRRHGKSVAAVIVEPVAGNMGVIPPLPGFLRGLRELTESHDALLVFDEVITGFRLGAGGAQGRYRVRPDLTCLGKILGHGLPVAAYGGRRDAMETVAPLGPVYQAGTLAGNPVAMAAGLATLDALRPSLYPALERRASRLERGLSRAAAGSRVPLRVQREASMIGLFFTDGPVRDYEEAKATSAEPYVRFFRSLLRRGVYLPPAPLESAFLSAAHTDAHIERIRAVAEGAFRDAEAAP